MKTAEEITREECKRLARELLRAIPDEWRPHLNTKDVAPNEASAALPDDARMRLLRKRLKRAGLNSLKNMLRAISVHKAFCARFSIPLYPLPADVVATALETYSQLAVNAAAIRSVNKLANGEGPRSNDRGGATAVVAIYNGYVGFRIHLNIDCQSDHPLVKGIARVGSGMPSIGSMAPIDACMAWEQVSRDESKSEYERAYGGGGYLGCASSLRVIDLIRTPDLTFEEVVIDGEEMVVAKGTARESKDKDNITMKPLPWRAPLVRLGKHPVDLEPLINSFPEGKKGTIFRDFKVNKGARKIIQNAKKWKNKPAEHHVIVESLRELARPTIGDRADSLHGHDQRHLLPEVARGLQLPVHVRETIGWWRSQPPLATGPGDAAAMEEAQRIARSAKKNGARKQFMSDRYSFVSGRKVESDAARAHCMKAMAVLCDGGNAAALAKLDVPVTDQVRMIAELRVKKAGE